MTQPAIVLTFPETSPTSKESSGLTSALVVALDDNAA
jgi:hypothetical protein